MRYVSLFFFENNPLPSRYAETIAWKKGGFQTAFAPFYIGLND